MAVFVDDAALPFKGKPRFHLCASTVDELHRFAAQVGVRPCWFHRGASFPHYDITAPQRDLAILQGAQAVRFRDIKRLTLASTASALDQGGTQPELPLA